MANKHEAITYVWKPLEDCLKLYPELYNEMARLYPKKYSTVSTLPTRPWYEDDPMEEITKRLDYNYMEEKQSDGAVRMMRVIYNTTIPAGQTANYKYKDEEGEGEETVAMGNVSKDKKVFSPAIVLKDSEKEMRSTELNKMGNMNVRVTEGPAGSSNEIEEYSEGGDIFMKTKNVTTQTATSVKGYESSEEAVKHVSGSKPHDWKAEQDNSKDKDQTLTSSGVKKGGGTKQENKWFQFFW